MAKRATTPKPKRLPLRYRVVVARYVSRHETIDEAVEAMNAVEIEGDDIAFVLEEKIDGRVGR